MLFGNNFLGYFGCKGHASSYEETSVKTVHEQTHINSNCITIHKKNILFKETLNIVYLKWLVTINHKLEGKARHPAPAMCFKKKKIVCREKQPFQ